jgi:hypothetical protein
MNVGTTQFFLQLKGSDREGQGNRVNDAAAANGLKKTGT